MIGETMKKILFLIYLLTITACSNPSIRSETDCEYACSMIANDLIETAPQGCICQEKPAK